MGFLEENPKDTRLPKGFGRLRSFVKAPVHVHATFASLFLWAAGRLGHRARVHGLDAQQCPEPEPDPAGGLKNAKRIVPCELHIGTIAVKIS